MSSATVIFLAVVQVATSIVQGGQLVRKELFDYLPGTALSTTGPGGGWSGGWMADNLLSIPLGSGYDVTAGSLGNAAFATYGLQATGNRFAEPADVSYTMWRGLSTPINWSGNSVTYVSVLVQWGGNHASTSSRIKFMLGDSNTYFALTGDGTSANKMRLSIRNTTAITVHGTDLYDRNVTYLLVAKIQTAASGNDTISMALFDPAEMLPATEPVWDVTASSVRGGASAVFGYEHVLYNSALCSMDELRIGETWDEVTGVPLVTYLQAMDLTLPKMAGVKTFYDAGLYTDALNAWRDIVMADLRATPMGEFAWHSSKTTGYQLAFADRLVGTTSEAQYSAYLASINREYVRDAWNLSGPPGTLLTNANWLAVPPDKLSADDMSSFMAFIPLTVKYWQNSSPGNQMFASKWFEIAGDFSRNCYDAINPLTLTEKRANYPSLSWNTDAQSALSQAWRVENIFKSLAVLAKSVPGGTKASGWMDSLDGRADLPPAGAYDGFSSRQLADIAVSLVEDHSIALMSRYLTAGAVPNQRFSGIQGLLLTSHFFDMFHDASTSLGPQADAAMLDYVTTMIYPDGGMLEQSLQYNESDARKMGELVDAFDGVTKSWSSPTELKTLNFWRMLWALRGPTFSQPQLGNDRRASATEVWTSGTLRSQWISSQLDKNLAKDSLSQQINNAYNGAVTNVPAFTSVAFPYAGYYVQRSGWTLDDMALFFMGGRSQRGHSMHDQNAVQLSAFGRDLLVASGPANYYTNTAPTPADDYLAESSSAKVNTILVDGNSQNRTNEAQSVHPDTIGALWHTSDYFDLVEGLHEQGYGSEMDVSHQRQTIFVKEAGLWVLLDNLVSTDTNSHTYTQAWNFLPYQTNSGTPVYGYKPEEVLTSGNMIYTADIDTTNTPNLRLYLFGENVTFTKYHGSTNPVYGWHARGFGDAIPAVDVHAEFSGAGSRQLLTVIRPDRGTNSGITSQTDVSSGAIKGFDCTTSSGVQLKVRSTLSSGVVLTAGGVSATASALLVTTAGGITRGIVLEAQTFTAGLLDVQNQGGRSFEFVVTANGVVSRQDMLVPQDFQWNGNGPQIVPDYGIGTNGWYNGGPPYQVWRSARFTVTELGDPAVSGDTADPDGDGVVNLLEYALDRLPLVAEAAAPLLIARVGNTVEASFFRARSEVRYEVLASPDLAGWDVIATDPGSVGATATVSEALGAGGGNRRFFRLRASIP